MERADTMSVIIIGLSRLKYHSDQIDRKEGLYLVVIVSHRQLDGHEACVLRSRADLD